MNKYPLLTRISNLLETYETKVVVRTHVIRTTYTLPKVLWATIIRSYLSIPKAWHTYENELVNMYITETTEAVLSLKTGKLTVYVYLDDLDV